MELQKLALGSLIRQLYAYKLNLNTGIRGCNGQ